MNAIRAALDAFAPCVKQLVVEEASSCLADQRYHSPPSCAFAHFTGSHSGISPGPKLVLMLSFFNKIAVPSDRSTRGRSCKHLSEWDAPA